MRFFDLLLVALEQRKRAWATHHLRPRDAATVGTRSDPYLDQPNCGIVLQGPVLEKNNFTRDSVRIYRQHYPDALIVLSTWDDQKESVLRSIERSGAEIVTQSQPPDRGPANINLQIASSIAGVRHCAEHGVDYVLKSRTDQRFYAPDTLAFLTSMLDVFPTSHPLKQNKRILASSFDTFKFRMYGLSDQFVFGETEDMLKFWGCPLDHRKDLPDPETLGAHAKLRYCEVYLVSEYFNRIGRDLAWTMQDSWQVFAEYFAIVDTSSVDLYWPKYTRFQEHRWRRYGNVHGLTELTFRDWLLLYQRWNRDQAAENAIELRGNDAVY